MRAFHKVLGLTSAFVLAAGISSCDSDISKTVSCSTTADCLKTAGTLFDPDASVAFLPECCAGVCVVPNSVGCDSNERFLNSAPLVGQCTPAPMCPPQPDMKEAPTGDM
jgi:hypothetical protein